MPTPARPSPATSPIDDLRPVIESALDRASQFGQGCPPSLASAVRHALLAPGKRLRPALVLMAAEACGGSLEAAMPGAVAVEMIHAYSLIHDDLPAMDDDDLRRGRPTVHVAFDEATAILAGDALLAEAFAHLAGNIPQPDLAAEAVRVLASAAGPTQLVGGQADDLAAEATSAPPSQPQPIIEGSSLQAARLEGSSGPSSSLERLESIHRRKTGALFAASLDLGAVLAGGDGTQRRILGNYARDIGLAFQIVDDLLDYTADSASLGKRAGKDARRGKLTYPGLLGVERARTKAEQLVESARGQIAVFDSAASRLMELADYVLERTH